MQTLWGSSNPRRNTISLNFYLLKARKPCIEYVVLHELVHFLYPNHSKAFYNFLTLYMPDWKNRKQILDNDVVRGL
jgi:predicted metal-dependent hydrolase